MPSKTIVFKNDKCSGGKQSKQRLTVLVGANSDGSEKLPLLVIGKSASPRCFKNIKTLPTLYMNNNKAWMTTREWETYLKKMDGMFIKQKRRVLFIADNCPSHRNIPDLKAINLQFLPPNVTSVGQPMDQGVIKILKGYYREHVLRKLVESVETEEVQSALDTKIDVLDALHFIKKSWDRLQNQSIANCFKKAGFPQSSFSSTVEICELENSENLNVLWQHENVKPITQNVSLAEFIEVDDLIQTSQCISDERILDIIESSEEKSDSDGEEGECYEVPATRKEILKSVNILRKALGVGDNMQRQIYYFHSIENALDDLETKKLVQPKITDYFQQS